MIMTDTYAPIRTMAIEITIDTYSVAIACLPPVFATLPRSIVMGHIVIINDPRVLTKGKKQTLTLANAWMTRNHFDKTYNCLDPIQLMQYQFTYVEKIAS
jgi:hypothetical protein